jgi:hypothetical protein
MAKSIYNSQDLIDSRDVIKRIEELEEDRENLQFAIDEAQEALETADVDKDDERPDSPYANLRKAVEDAIYNLESWDDSDDADELTALKNLAEDAGSSPGWNYGETLIRDSYFEEYAEQLATDICDMGKAEGWPFRHIDWEAAAKELKQDYFTVDFDGEDYWILA